MSKTRGKQKEYRRVQCKSKMMCIMWSGKQNENKKYCEYDDHWDFVFFIHLIDVVVFNFFLFLPALPRPYNFFKFCYQAVI